jgi:hypothetical protein
MPIQSKTGEFLPEKMSHADPLPHEDPTAPDPYTLTTEAPQHSRGHLLPQVQNYSLFQECLFHSANNKAAGPDGIPNELLKFMPEPMQQAIHNLFVVMWITGDTPSEWKCSDTVLLYKKGDPLDIKNYRPIALALTIYKLWTRVITEILSTFAEVHKMLSSSQEGFRKRRNTARQLSNVLNALEDAAHTSQDVYMLYVDFSSAFNTLDHDKLLRIMWRMGFPMDVLLVVRNIYSEASTHFMTPFGKQRQCSCIGGLFKGTPSHPSSSCSSWSRSSGGCTKAAVGTNMAASGP